MLADSTSLRNPFLKPISSYVFQLNIFRNLIQVIFPIQFVFAIQINTFFPIQLFIKILKKNRREVFKQNRCENIQILFSILNSTKLVFNVPALTASPVPKGGIAVNACWTKLLNWFLLINFYSNVVGDPTPKIFQHNHL